MTEYEKDLFGSGGSRFEANFTVSIPWQYPNQPTDIGALYHLAKRKIWDAQRDVEWSVDVKSTFPTKPENNPLAGFQNYDCLTEAEKREIAWSHHSIELSEILHGEQGALIMASQLVSCIPSVDARLFASAQVYDEARHVEFFSRYLHEISGTIHPPSNALKAVLECGIKDSRWDMKFLICQILIESLAMAQFQELRRTTTVPPLRSGIEYIIKDEARHTRYGVAVLKQLVDTLEPSEKEYRGEFVISHLLKLSNALNEDVRIAHAVGWDGAALRRHMRLYRLRNPETNRNRFRILRKHLDEIGLLSTKVAEHFKWLT